MKENQASKTAYGAAMHRYFHQLFDDPKILSDPVTPKLFASRFQGLVAESRDQLKTAEARGLRSHIVLRSRYSEDQLQRALDQGVCQVILLGAGFDTYAYRQTPISVKNAQIFEVDHPSTQQQKRELLQNANLPVVPNLRFVPVDFETMVLLNELIKSGFDPGLPTFVSWLGVSVYLTEQAIDAVLRFTALLAPGSQIVFSYSEPLPEGKSLAREKFAKSVESVGEPWISFFTPRQIESKLTSLGFSHISPLGHQEAEALFKGRTDGLKAPRRLGLVTATV